MLQNHGVLFCSFGGSCMYLHNSKEDYKQGWQLDKVLESVTKGTKVIGGTRVATEIRNVEEGAQTRRVQYSRGSHLRALYPEINTRALY